jgi:hypothetical protein
LGFFWQILLRGVLGVVRKPVGGSFLLHFYVEVFKNLYRGYMRGPLPPPLFAFMNLTIINNYLEALSLKRCFYTVVYDLAI